MGVVDFNANKRRCVQGYIHDYMMYASYLEGPPEFNLWVGTALVGITMGRKCYVTLGFDRVYANTYVVLVGPSAVGKGMAMNAGRRVLVESLGDNGVPMLAQKTTPEALVEHLKEITEEDSSRGALIYSPEFSNLIGKSKYDQSLIQDLTDYYDCLERKTYRTRAHGEEILYNLCVNLLAASTPEWLKSSIPEDSIGGGFLSRLLIINRYERARREAFTILSEEQVKAKENCVNDLKHIQGLKGEFTLDVEAFRSFSDWYEVYLEQEIAEAGPNLESYYERKKLLVLKLAMISSASVNDSLKIKQDDIEFALKILGDNEGYLKQVVRHMGLSETGKKINKIRNIVKKAGTIDRSSLLRRVDVSAEELNPIIDTLHDTGEIVVDRVTGESGRNQIMYGWVSDDERRKKDGVK